MKISKNIKPPPGFTMITITLHNGLKKLVAKSDKGYNSPKVWNNKKWITIPNKC